MDKILELILHFFASGQPLAGLATIASILAFFAGRRSNTGSQRFLARWWPELIFYPSILFNLSSLFVSYFALAVVDIKHHRFTYARAGGYEIVYPEGRSRIDMHSNEEHFAVEVAGKIWGPELQDIFSHFRGKDKSIDAHPKIPIYLLVSELTRSNGNALWWPQQLSILESDGTYKTNCYIGGTEIESATDGEVFEVRTYIPYDPRVILSKKL